MKGKAFCALAASIGAAFLAVHAAAAAPDSVVWVQTNEPTGNHVVVYDRAVDGRLTRAGTYATGGLGGVAAPGAESDPPCLAGIARVRRGEWSALRGERRQQFRLGVQRPR